MAHKQLTSGERYQIEVLIAEGFNQTQIAGTLGKSPSTISRLKFPKNSHSRT